MISDMMGQLKLIVKKMTIFCLHVFLFTTKQAAEVRDEVNACAEAVSRGLIKNFLDPGTPSPNTALILANGLYFKGTWDHDYRFVKERTERKDFYLLNGDTISVPFMTSSKKYPCGSFDGFKVLNIPYENGKCERHFSMYFFLPDERYGLQSLLEKLINSDPETYFRLPKVVLDKFWIPKFKFSYKFEVSEAMRDTGAPFSFAENPTDLSEMLHIPEGARLPPSSIIQKACIEIDEKGTEAAAITALLMFGSSNPLHKPKTLSFVADHPFVFMIREAKSRLVFFTGVVLNPSQSD